MNDSTTHSSGDVPQAHDSNALREFVAERPSIMMSTAGLAQMEAQMEAAPRFKCITHFAHDIPLSCFTTRTWPFNPRSRCISTTDLAATPGFTLSLLSPGVRRVSDSTSSHGASGDAPAW